MKGSITVVALLTKHHQLKISIEDTGIGIKQSDLCTIFTLFGRLEETQHLNPQGCGLGLSISNLLVTKLGGDGISVVSLPGKGSTFSFCIDIHQQDTRYSSGVATPVGEIDIVEENATQPITETWMWSGSYIASPTFPKILIVDDSSFNRIVAQKLLESQGYKSAAAANGFQALELIREAEFEGHGFSFVLMDVEMPGMDGLTATRAIKQLQREERLPRRLIVVGCSANFSEEDRENAMEAGMDHFLEKPIVRAQLYGLLSQHFV